MISKPTADEFDDLKELLQHEGYKPLMQELERLCQAQQSRILTYNLSEGSPEDLAYQLCYAEGARRLLNDFRSRLEKIKATIRN